MNPVFCTNSLVLVSDKILKIKVSIIATAKIVKPLKSKGLTVSEYFLKKIIRIKTVKANKIRINGIIMYKPVELFFAK